MSLWDDWLANYKLAQQRVNTVNVKEQKATRRPITDEEIMMAGSLDRCSLRRGSYHQRMVDALVEAGKTHAEITERQAWTLRGLYYMYRKQHGDKNAKKPDGWM